MPKPKPPKFIKTAITIPNTRHPKRAQTWGYLLNNLYIHIDLNNSKEYALTLLPSGALVVNTLFARDGKRHGVRSMQRLARAVATQVTERLDLKNVSHISVEARIQISILVYQWRDGKELDVNNLADRDEAIKRTRELITKPNKNTLFIYKVKQVQSTNIRPCLFRKEIAVALLDNTVYNGRDVIEGIQYLVLQGLSFYWAQAKDVKFIK